MPRLLTIPHAPIERVNMATGEKERLEPGSFVNVNAARAIYAVIARGEVKPAVIIELAEYRWHFEVASSDEAREWARKLAQAAAA